MYRRSLVSQLRGETLADWRTSPYYRYFHDPSDDITRAHLGVRTATHKLIYSWKQQAYEMFDLTQDPMEQHSLLFGDGTQDPVVAVRFAALKAEIVRLQKEFKDDGHYADSADWPPGSADRPPNHYQRIGDRTVAEAIATSGTQ